MRALLPQPSEAVDLREAYAPGGRGARGRFVRCGMIATFDGAVALRGRSGSLGGPADRRVFAVLRSWADVVVVGAGTARAEGYGPVHLDADHREARRSRGQGVVPPIAVVTRSGLLDLTSPFFSDAEVRPIVVTAAGTARAQVQRIAAVADVVVAGEREVDLAAAFDQLGEAGYRSVLVEGGPGLNGDLVHAGLVDELCLTLSPYVAAGAGPRLVGGGELDPPMGLEVVHLLETGGLFFWRLAVAAPPEPLLPEPLLPEPLSAKPLLP